MNMASKAILTTLLVLMISSVLIVTPLHASALTLPKSTSKATLTVPSIAMRCPNGSLAPNNKVSNCPTLVPSSKLDNQSPQNSNYKAQATYVQNGGTSNAGVVAQQATQAHNTQNSQQASNAHQATQATQAHEPQTSKSNTPTTLQLPNTAKYTTPTLKVAPKNPVPKLP
ncbi:MAG TPA: hypothetical protein VFA69_04890 [Candidatus Nitrosotalea sp.]|nr:hypothetical protein [Candidatus Nitrosotalea sp.]